MKISDYIKSSLNESGSRNLESAILHACLAIDGTAKKEYPAIPQVGKRFRLFIRDNIDIIEFMFGGINLVETIFPFKDSKGVIGMKFEDIIYEKFRCNLAHGSELEPGYGVNMKVAESIDVVGVDILNKSITLPESVIYALGLASVLAKSNHDQFIGETKYWYRDMENVFVVDNWWGKVDCARRIMPFKKAVRVKLDFSQVWPK